MKIIDYSDYRFGNWEKRHIFSKELKKLKTKIHEEHPRITNYYINIKRDKNPLYFKIFSDLFDGRCCYCGNTIKATADLTLFQIDHIYSPQDESIDDLLNLAPSCPRCNNWKSDICDKKEKAKTINPYRNIQNVFYRDSDYGIKIRSEYMDNDFVSDFYNKLRLGHEYHRITFFILCIDYLANYYKESFLYQKESVANAIKSALLDKIKKYDSFNH